MLYEKSKAKDIIYDKENIRRVVSETINKMATVVGATLGPGGNPVLIERDGMSPLITKDGVTVAKSLGVEKAEDNIVIEAAKEICINTAKEAGDGTTTAIVLADAITKHGQDFINANPKYNPQRIINELHELYDTIIVPYLKDNAIKVNNEEQLRNVARISANGDNKIADAVVDAVISAGDDGTVLLEEGQGDVMRVEKIDGYVVTSGLKELGQIGPVFINDKANQQVNMEKGVIFLYDGTMHDLLVPGLIQDLMESSQYMGFPLIILAHDFSDIVLERLAKNVKGGLTIVPIKTPRSGLPNGRSMFLHDMAAYSGGKVYDPGSLDQVKQDDEDAFGVFECARCNMYETFIQCDAAPERLEARVTELKSVMKSAIGELDRMHLRAAIGKLTGGVSTIWVGGTSELEVREKKARVEDAVEAVRSAIAEGIIPGGCSVHIKLSEIIKKHPKKQDSWVIMEAALLKPFDLLIRNCGEESETILNCLMKQHRKLPTKVFDAREHKIVNAFKAGIIEPAKVSRVAIGNALSVASLLISLGGIVVVPRDSAMENQLAMAEQSFKSMMSAGNNQ